MSGRGLRRLLGGRSFDGPSLRDRHGTAAAVLVVGGDELLGVAVDAVLGDVETVELVLGLDPEAYGRLEYGEDRVGGQEDEPAAGDYAQSLHAELGERSD